MRAPLLKLFLASLALSGCVPSEARREAIAAASTNAAGYVSLVAASCVKADFDPEATRKLLLAHGFVEANRPLQHQLEKFPPGSNAFSQGVTLPWKHPCKPSVHSYYARESLASAATVLMQNGFVTADGLYFTKNSRRLRLEARGYSLGGPTEINLEPF